MRRYLVAVSCAFVVFSWLTIFLTKGIVNDDIYILLRYSKNLAEHGQFTYNLDHPTYSLTTPLWGFLIGCFGCFVHNYVLLAQIMASIAAIACVPFLYRISRRVVGENAVVPVLLFLLDPYVIGVAHCGAEMTLFCLLGFAFVDRVTRIDGKISRYFASPLLLALLILTRPEGVVVLAGCALCFIMALGIRRALQVTVPLGVITLIMLTPWLIYAQKTFHTIIPTSIILKSVGSHGRIPFASWRTLMNFILLIAKGYLPHMLVIAVGVFLLYRDHYRWDVGTANDRAIRLLPPILVTALLLFYFTGLKEGSISSRYLVTLSPYLMIVTAQAYGIIRRRFVSKGSFGQKGVDKRRKPLLCITFVMLLLLLNIGAVYSRTKRTRIVDEPGVRTGRWIAENIPSDAVIGNMGGAGQVAYFFDGQIWDYNLISMMGEDIELAQKRRRHEHIEPSRYLYKNPDYFLVPLYVTDFDQFGEIVYENEIYRIIKVSRD